MGPRPGTANPSAGQLLFAAAAAAALFVLAWLAALVGALSVQSAWGATGFAVVVVFMGSARYAEFVVDTSSAEAFEDELAATYATLLFGGLILGAINSVISLVMSTFGHNGIGLCILVPLDCAAAFVCAKERAIEVFFSPSAKKRA